MYNITGIYWSVAKFEGNKLVRKVFFSRDRNEAWKRRDALDQAHGACAKCEENKCPSYRVLIRGDVKAEDERPAGTVKCP